MGGDQLPPGDCGPRQRRPPARQGWRRTAAAFLDAGLVDRLLLYRAPILLGGKPALAGLGLTDIATAHGRWRLADRRRLGSDTLEVYVTA